MKCATPMIVASLLASILLLADMGPVLAKDRLFTVQVSSFREQERANRNTAALKAKGYESFYREVTQENGVWYRVYAGRYSSRPPAENLAKRLEQDGLVSGGIVRELGADTPGRQAKTARLSASNPKVRKKTEAHRRHSSKNDTESEGGFLKRDMAAAKVKKPAAKPNGGVSREAPDKSKKKLIAEDEPDPPPAVEQAWTPFLRGAEIRDDYDWETRGVLLDGGRGRETAVGFQFTKTFWGPTLPGFNNQSRRKKTEQD